MAFWSLRGSESELPRRFGVLSLGRQPGPGRGGLLGRLPRHHGLLLDPGGCLERSQRDEDREHDGAEQQLCAALGARPTHNRASAAGQGLLWRAGSSVLVLL